MNNRTITDDYTAKSWKAGDKLLASDLTKMSVALDAVENELVDVTNTTIPSITTRLDTAEAAINNLQTSAGAVDVPQGQTVTQYVDQKVADLVGTAPETLDTIAEVAAAIETNGDAIEAIQSLVTENGTAIDNVQTTVEDLGARTETLEQTAVKFTEFQREQDETVRKTIQLDNFDSISGVTTTGAGVNLAMVSKWDKADFGSAQIPLNLNSKDGVVTINDGAQVATLGDLPDVSGYIKSEDLAPYATTASVDEKLATKQDAGDYPVYQKFVAGADPAERKTIQLANADSISGVASTGGGANLIMMSKWDKVDIGSVNYQMNLNSPNGVVQINDEKVVATTDQIPDTSVFASKTELNDAIEAVEANIPDKSQFVNIDVYNEDKAGLQTAIDGKQPAGDYPVYKQFVAGASDKQRKTIQLANADSISGIMSTGAGVNLAMVSEWDKADFGSSQLPLNLNATDGIVTINDSKTIATVDQIPDVSEFATTSYVDSKVASVMKYAGSVKTVDDLPDSDLTIGDVYNVEEDGSNYAWDGEQWDKLGGTIDLSSYATVESVQTGLEGKADVVHMHNIADINGLQDTLNGKQPVGDYAVKSEIPSVEGLASETYVDQAIAPVSEQLETKQDKGDYALNSALEPLATKEAVAGLKVVDLGTFDKVEGASYAAGADGVYNNKEAVVLTFDTTEGSGVIFNTMTAANSAAQRMYWNNQVLSRTVTNGSGTGWNVLSNFTELQNRAIKSTLFTLTTEADSETIKAAMTNENNKVVTAADLDSCLKYGYTIRDYALQSGSIFVGWTGSAYTLTYIGFASPTSEPYVMSVVVNVTPEGEYSIVRNGTRGQILTSANLANNKTFAAIADVAPVIVNINLRDPKLTTEVQEKETILGWFGVTTDVELKQLIAGTRPMFVRYGISLSTNPHYYKMPIEYVAYESATQLKLVFCGLDTSNDQPVRYTIVANLDGTPIEQGGNVSMVLEPIDTQADVGELATKQELSDGLAGKAEAVHTHAIADVTGLQDALDSKQAAGEYLTVEDLPDTSNFATKSEVTAVEQKIPSVEGFATTEALTSGLAGKQDKGDYALKSEIPSIDGLATTEQVQAMAVSYGPKGLSSEQFELKQGENVVATIYNPEIPMRPQTIYIEDDAKDFCEQLGLTPQFINGVAWKEGTDSLDNLGADNGPYIVIAGYGTDALEMTCFNVITLREHVVAKSVFETNNTELQSSISGKANAVHTHVAADVTDLSATITAALQPYATTETVNGELAKKIEQPVIDEIYSTLGEMNTNTGTALASKVDWDQAKKVISLPIDGSISALREADPEQGTQPEGGVLLAQRTYDEGVTLVTEVGTTKNKLTLNASERPQIDIAGGSSEKVAYQSDLPVRVTVPVHTSIGGLQDQLYSEAEIFGWFGVADIDQFNELATSTNSVWIGYTVDASFQKSAYRYLVNYMEYVPDSKSIKVIWIGPDSLNGDVISKFVLTANLDQTVIEGSSNVKLAITSLE